MAGLNSFDVVSEVDLQEVKNARDQASKELSQRFDFRGSKSKISLEGNELEVISDDEHKLKSVMDILQSKLVKRGVSLKSLNEGKLEDALGGTVRKKITLSQGISSEKAKEISKVIRDSKLKVQSQIQGDQIRVSSKSRDHLQDVIRILKEKDFGIPLQFSNYRS
ncbi:MAG TPA: YajQ family cyclic di-GMP-binding protein [Nitrospiria bacterium]